MSNYTLTPLISNIDNYGRKTDPNLINPWGLINDKDGSFWIAANGTGELLHYDKNYNPILPIISIPASSGTGAGAPSGIVSNNTKGFVIKNGSTGASGSSQIIIVSEDGFIGGFNKNVDPINAIPALINVNGIYKGVALGGGFLFAANFSSGRIEKYDSTWNLVSQFTDPSLDDNGYSPFNILVDNKSLYVMFAERDGKDDARGPGNGFVDIFSFDGKLIRRLINRGPLNSPWGALIQGDQLYVGNFGDGRINVFDKTTGVFIGPIKDANNNPISIDGLWGIIPICRASSGACKSGCGCTNYIYFAAGINSENSGLFGYLKPVSTK